MLSRFSEKLEFNDWKSENCVALFRDKCKKESVDVPEGLDATLLNGFKDLIQRDGWGNARDVNTVHDKTKSSRDCRSNDEGIVEGGYILEDVHSAFNEMKSQRRRKQGNWKMLNDD